MPFEIGYFAPNRIVSFIANGHSLESSNSYAMFYQCINLLTTLLNHWILNPLRCTSMIESPYHTLHITRTLIYEAHIILGVHYTLNHQWILVSYKCLAIKDYFYYQWSSYESIITQKNLLWWHLITTIYYTHSTMR